MQSVFIHLHYETSFKQLSSLCFLFPESSACMPLLINIQDAGLILRSRFWSSGQCRSNTFICGHDISGISLFDNSLDPVNPGRLVDFFYGLTDISSH